MAIVEVNEDFMTQALEFTKELVKYKRMGIEWYKGKEEYVGDLGYGVVYPEADMRGRYNINDAGDIYFINSDSINNLMYDYRHYIDDSKRESRGYIKKAVTESISSNHDSKIVNELINKHFNRM